MPGLARTYRPGQPPVDPYSKTTLYQSRDNITDPALWNMATFGDSYSSSPQFPVYPDYFLQLCRRFARVYRLGLGGSTTATLLSILPAHLATVPSPRYVIIEGGANDIGTGVADSTTKANMTSMYNLIIAAGAIPVPLMQYPRGSYDATKEALRVGQNNWAKAYARTNGFPFVDAEDTLGEWVTDATIPHLKAEYDNGDGTHTSSDGAKAVAEVVFEQLFTGGAVEKRDRGLI